MIWSAVKYWQWASFHRLEDKLLHIVNWNHSMNNVHFHKICLWTEICLEFKCLIFPNHCFRAAEVAGHVLLKSSCSISFHQCPVGPWWPSPASVSILSAAVTSDHCVCVCRSPQWCTCSATPRATGTDRLCETRAASRAGSSLVRITHTPPTNTLVLLSNTAPEPGVWRWRTKGRDGRLLWRGHYYCLCILLYTPVALLLSFVRLQMGLEMYTVRVQCFSVFTPLSLGCFCHWALSMGRPPVNAR